MAQAMKEQWAALPVHLSSFPIDNKAALLLVAFLLSAFIFIKRDRSFATVCASEFLVSALIYPALSIVLTWQTWGSIQTFLFTYAIKDFVFIVLLSRIYTPPKFWFMAALFVSMTANWLTLAAVEFGCYVAYDIRPFFMRCVIAVQLVSMVYTLWGDNGDSNGGIRNRANSTRRRLSHKSRLV